MLSRRHLALLWLICCCLLLLVTRRQTTVDRQEVFRHRLARVEQTCRMYNISEERLTDGLVQILNRALATPEYWREKFEVEVDPEHFQLAREVRTMGCFINKVASSSFVTAFLHLRGIDPVHVGESPHMYISELQPESNLEFRIANRTYYKFMVVRDPMARLLSCYRNKMINGKHQSLYNFRRTVLRVAGPSKVLSDDDPRLEEPVFNGADSPDISNIPTFEQFLLYVLSTDLQGHGFDGHWVPYWRQCVPCQVHYDAIAKLETNLEDFITIWQLSGLENKVDIPWTNKLGENSDTRRRYYSTLSRETILRTLRAYQVDFHMFGYSMEDILKLAGYSTLSKEERKMLHISDSSD